MVLVCAQAGTYKQRSGVTHLGRPGRWRRPGRSRPARAAAAATWPLEGGRPVRRGAQRAPPAITRPSSRSCRQRWLPAAERPRCSSPNRPQLLRCRMCPCGSPMSAAGRMRATRLASATSTESRARLGRSGRQSDVDHLKIPHIVIGWQPQQPLLYRRHRDGQIGRNAVLRNLSSIAVNPGWAIHGHHVRRRLICCKRRVRAPRTAATSPVREVLEPVPRSPSSTMPAERIKSESCESSRPGGRPGPRPPALRIRSTRWSSSR